mgnify:CR=1 FL=1
MLLVLVSMIWKTISNIFYHTAGNGSKEYVLECTRHYDTANMYAQGGWVWYFG